MKFYMHLEDPSLTVVIVWAEKKAGTLQDALKIFCQNLTQKYPSLDKTTGFIIVNSKGKQLDLSKGIIGLVKHMDDLFVKPKLTTSVAEKGTVLNEMKSLNIDGPGREVTESTSSDLKRKYEAVEEKKNQAILRAGNEEYRKAILLYKDILDLDHQNRSSIIGLITCYIKAARSKEALMYVKQGLRLYPNDMDILRLAGETYLNMGDGDAAIEQLMKYCKLGRQSGGINKEEKQDVQVLLARAYLLLEKKDMAITILQGVLRENLDHPEALAEYAVLLYPLGQDEHCQEAMSALLSALAKKRNDQTIKTKFASLCKQQNGMKVLESVAGTVLTDPNALVFLALALRDCGALTESLELLKRAHDLDPSDPSVILTYVHTLEIVNKYGQAVQCVKNYVNSFSYTGVGQLTCSVLDPYLSMIADDMSLTSIANELLDVGDPLNVQDRDYTDEEKYFLALLFTLVKILYIKGLLVPVSPLVALIGPFTEGKQLHLTNIRNEAAYFSCIQDVFRSYSEIPTVLPSERFLYFVGDSHCLPPAWQTLRVQNQEMQLYPVLSTGTKIWHLRSQSTFYPKVNFLSAVQNIPDGAAVIVCLGEIDCREAFLKCWEKARYDTIEDAMHAVIQIYLQTLKSLQARRHWRVYIHPVMPAIDLTRPIVMQFNKILATRLLTEPSLYWLNFVNDLLTPDGNQLKEEFKFDDTHIHPNYVSLLGQALSEFIP